MAFGIARQETAGSCQCAVMAEGSKDIAQFAFFRGGIADAISGQKGEFQRMRDFDCSSIAGFLFAM